MSSSSGLFGPSLRPPPPGSERAPRCAISRVDFFDPRWLAACAREFVVFDLETTGLSPARDEVVELSAIRFVDRQPTEKLTSLVRPAQPIPPRASQVHGITNEMVCDQPLFEAVLPAFLSFVGTTPLVGHNVDFDLGFIDAGCRRHALGARFDVIDTLKVSRKLFALPNHKLGTIAAHLGIDSVLHRSEADAWVCARILLEGLRTGV